VKDIIKIIIMVGFVLCFNTNSFASVFYAVNYAAWGGYVFNGKTESADLDGRQFGINAHLHYPYSNIPFRLGVYYQFTKVKSDHGDVLRKNSAGLDVNIIWELTSFCPYVRGTWAFMDKIDNDNKSFKSYGVGFGVEYFMGSGLRLFGEYMYDKSRHDIDINLHSVNVGLKLYL
jgi:hypothetical protein